MLELATLTVSLRGDHDDLGSCDQLEQKIRDTVDKPKYQTGAAIMPMPESRSAWESDHRTARKRAWRSERLGYRFDEIDRGKYSADIFDINTSLTVRQGRPMSAGYVEYHQQSSLPDYPCELHAIRAYGVLEHYRLVAYMTLYRINELALISMILGHGDDLRNDIMYLLFGGMVERQAHLGGWIYYNLWDSGTDGLRYYKKKVGFYEEDVAWST